MVIEGIWGAIGEGLLGAIDESCKLFSEEIICSIFL